MKLYGMNLSNFATKSRIVVYEKGAQIETVAPPGGMKSPEYLKINPLGKIPTLDADGTIIPESEVINEYLEEKFPNPPLLPKSPEARAKVRLLTRFHDLYFDPPLRALPRGLGLDVQPHDPVVPERLADAGVLHRAPTQGHDGWRRATQQLERRRLLGLPERPLSVLDEHAADRLAQAPLHQLVEVGHLDAAPLCGPPGGRGLARSHEADEHQLALAGHGVHRPLVGHPMRRS